MEYGRTHLMLLKIKEYAMFFTGNVSKNISQLSYFIALKERKALFVVFTL